MCVCLMIAEDSENGADTLVHSLQADGAVGQLRTSLTLGVVLALLSGKIRFKRQRPFKTPIKYQDLIFSSLHILPTQEVLCLVYLPTPVISSDMRDGKTLTVLVYSFKV